MRNLSIIFAMLFFGITLFAQEETVSYIMNDGSVKTYNLNDIEDISMKNGQATYEMKIYLKNSSPVSYFSYQFDSVKYSRDSYNNYAYKVYSGTNQFSYLLADIDSVSYYNDVVVVPTIEMLLIPAGTFQMGNTGAYSGYPLETPVHTVTLSKAFYMSKYEVTQKQYQAVMGNNPSHYKGENIPVANLPWYDAVAFCNALSLQEGKTPCYTIKYTINGTSVTCNWDANGYRLPTEAEWEYACKAGTSTDFYNGSLTNPDYTPIDENLDLIGWYKGNSYTPHPVGQKQPNAFGLYDMLGNVSEWCWDKEDIYSSKAVTDPTGPTGPSSGLDNRVFRGGGSDDYAGSCRSARRMAWASINYSIDFGFRIVRVDIGYTVPSLTSISPKTAIVGNIVTITGTDFGAERGSNYVNFPSENIIGIRATEYTSWSDTRIEVRVPNGAKSGELRVVVNGVKSNGHYVTIENQPVISSISPSSASIGMIITVNGKDFGGSKLSSIVSFAGTNVNSYIMWSDTRIEVRVPNGAKSGELWVVVNGVKSNEVDFTIKEYSLQPTDMVFIPAGAFGMGNNSTYYEGGWDDDTRPVHGVRISRAFYMSKYEVTQQQYEAVMGTNPSRRREYAAPVEYVTWYDAVEFCNKLSVNEGKTPCYTISGTRVTCNWDANGYRLPTEAEWEYACKAGTGTDFYNGDITNQWGSWSTPIDPNLDLIGWYLGNSGSSRTCGQKQPNAFGLYDMSGNVMEWCWDWFSNYGSSQETDPIGNSNGDARVCRGGAYNYYALYCRSAFRFSKCPDDKAQEIGFRIVRLDK